MLARSAKGMRLSQEQIAAMTVQRKAEWNALSPPGLVLRIRRDK
jgi:hypothetical protein